jgi:pantoate--beta-alanine ligase
MEDDVITARTLKELQLALHALPRPLALVPTMGALHAGHLALVAAGRAQAASVVASVFVNPLQFAASEDLSRYPKDEAGDLAMLEAAGCDVAWLPSVEVMYPPGAATVIEVGGPSEGFEGTARPGHFRGVATVVGKLFHQTRADLAMFGEKDWQQVQVVRQMAEDLDWPIQVVAVPTVREADGLAMSSRNRFLSPADRALAPVLHGVLQQVAAGLAQGAATAVDEGTATLTQAGFGVDYLALVDGRSMKPIDAAQDGARLITVARLGSVRLLDNVPVAAPAVR